jgi:RNA polymerase sigma factor (sigma-70 family)
MSHESLPMIHEVSGSLFRLIRGMVRDRDEALDLTQDVLVRLLRRPLPKDPARLKGYAMRSAYHAALNALRDRKRRVQIHEKLQKEPESLYAGSLDTVPDSETDFQRRLLGEALAQLSSKQREAIELRFYGSLTIDEISTAMNISTGAVKVHLYRALGRLNELMVSAHKEQ